MIGSGKRDLTIVLRSSPVTASKRCSQASLWLLLSARPDGNSPTSIPIGKARTVQEGQDISVFAYGLMVHYAVEAAKQHLLGPRSHIQPGVAIP